VVSRSGDALGVPFGRRAFGSAISLAVGFFPAMIEALKTVPEPEETSFTTPDGVVIQMDWPPNLNVLEAFDHCWEKTYREAYGTPECAAPEGDT